MEDSIQLLKNKLTDATKHLTQSQNTVVEHALLQAISAHQSQKRRSGEDYIIHPLSVAILLAKWGMDFHTISAALLHDVIEDTHTTETEILKNFGEEIMHLVYGMSKIQNFKFENKRSQQAHNFRKMLLAITNDYRVIFIKLADRLHNISTIKHLRRQKQKEISLETLEIYAPIARRLGLEDIFEQLSEKSFITIYPIRVAIIQKKIDQLASKAHDILNTTKKNIHSVLEKEGLMHVKLYSRQKNIYSIYQKMHTKHFKEITDIYGICIVLDNTQSCYAVLGIIHQLYKPLPHRFKDYIALPKHNGYQSLHTTIITPRHLMLEIQIRSEMMDAIATYGVAAHWLYKEGGHQQYQFYQKNITESWIHQIAEANRQSSDSLEFLEHIKIHFENQEDDKVYICTPTGEIIELPKRSSGIDFAYAIHTDLGNQCIGLLIDNKRKPITTPLKNGQTIEIITDPNAFPKANWLAYAVTSKAQLNIKQSLKLNQQKNILVSGQKIIDILLKKYKKEKFSDLSDKIIQSILKQNKCKTINEFYKMIALGQIMPLSVIKIINNQNNQINRESKWKNIIRQIQKIKRPNIQNNFISLGECCYPIEKDQIVAEINEAQTIIIHRSNCQQYISNKKYSPLNFFPIDWEDIQINQFKSSLIIKAYTKKTVNKIIFQTLKALQTCKIELCNINTKKDTEKSDYQVIKLDITIKKRENLNKAIKIIKSIQGVESVSRIK